MEPKEKGQAVDDIHPARGSSLEMDPEKDRSRLDSDKIGDMIPDELLKEYAPNGETEYLIEKVNEITVEEAVDIVAEALEFHDDDWNFPSDLQARMRRLLEGPKAYGEFYERDLKLDAVIIRWSSPYPEVRSACDPRDPGDVPIETIRAYFLGFVWACIGTFFSTFFNSRFPSISKVSVLCFRCGGFGAYSMPALGGSVIQILIYPCGKLLETVLPDWGFTAFGTRHSLNPGPWTFMEQMFATITFNIAWYTTNSYGMILVQRSPVYYGQNFIDFGYQLTLTLFVQLMGMGFAGYLRRFSVYPIKAFWPTLMPTIAMNRALTSPETKEKVHGWSISRYRFFFYCAFGMFIYHWLPGYLFQALSTFNWMTWIAPENLTLAVLTGSGLGLGLFNPITTFDWNVATSSYAALSIPFFVTATMYCGSIFGGLIILGMWYTNQYDTAYLPINNSNPFANDGTVYKVQKVVVNNKLDEELYQQYSPPYYTAGMIMSVAGNFCFYPVYFFYIMGNQWKTIRKAYVDFWKGLTKGQGNFENAKDIWSRRMARYPEVPDWWFLIILAASIVAGCIFLKVYPLHTPIWLIFLMIAINLVFAVPLSLLSAMTGTNLSLGALIQVITGYALPNNPNAFLFSQTLGSWALAGYADNYVQDQKMAHYCNIAPRAVFRSQIITIIITCFVAVGTQNFILNNVKDLCDPEQPSKFTCANDGAPLYASSLMWGVLGSKRMFLTMYPILSWCFLIGTGIAFVFLLGQYLGPRYLPRIRQRISEKVGEKTFARLDATVFRWVGLLEQLNPVLVIQGIQHWAPSNMAYKTPGFILSFIFMYVLKQKKTSWWIKYNYVLSAAFTCGIAFAALIMFFAVQYNPKELHWWGNSVFRAGIDAKLVGRLPLPERGYFGPEKGSFEQ